MIATALQVVGILMVTVGAWLVAPPVGLIVGGLGVLAFGLAAERSA